ncbi:MAG TPA: tetratricopeptide repeat protein [Candidatus Tectomicrobia bacterium]|jgi:hypothetical protein
MRFYLSLGLLIVIVASPALAVLIGDYHCALAHYHKALDLNPHHRGTLEYLGEAYLDMGCVAQAHALLTRLEVACQRIMGEAPGWQEWQELQAAIAAYRGSARRDCSPP